MHHRRGISPVHAGPRSHLNIANDPFTHLTGVYFTCVENAYSTECIQPDILNINDSLMSSYK